MAELHKLLPNMMTARSTVYITIILQEFCQLRKKKNYCISALLLLLLFYHLYAGYLELYK